jgi:hypothetical protein
MSCNHPASRVIAPKKETWQWCRDCGAFRERPEAVWNMPSNIRELRAVLRDFLGVHDCDD